MLDHIGLDIRDIKKAKEFFLAALKPLGYELFFVLGPDGHNIEVVCHDPE
jgi:catechol 2,3-dioxygenase-like lactoylglutathione lyase family enzyme